MSETEAGIEERWPKPEPVYVRDQNAKELALGIIEQAVQDWKDLCKRIPKKKLCRAEVERRKCMFDQLRRFLYGEWCSQLCCNSIRRSFMVEELEKMYQRSGFLQQAKGMEAGDKSC